MLHSLSSHPPAAFERTRREVGHFSLLTLEYPPNYLMPRHAHDSAIICMAINGGVTERYAGKTRTFEPFSVSYLPACHSHASKVSAVGLLAFSLNVPVQWLHRAVGEAGSLNDYLFTSRGRLAGLSMRLFRESRNDDRASHLAIEGIVLEMLAEAMRHPQPRPEREHPRWLTEARDILCEQSAEKISLTSLADSVGVHPVHLSRTFRKFHGCSMSDYSRTMRIEKACGKLLSTHDSIADIASEQGFSDQSHFTRLFKRVTGMTPGEYRTKLQKR